MVGSFAGCCARAASGTLRPRCDRRAIHDEFAPPHAIPAAEAIYYCPFSRLITNRLPTMKR